MRMRLHKMAQMALLFATASSVFATQAQTSGTSQTKAAPSKSGRASHRTRSSKKSRRRERGQKAPTPERISEIQQALAKDGSFTGKPNGKWDESTVEAMRKFQEAHGLNPSGKLDAKTLQQLGLGSQTAGVAPPLPPTSSSAVTKAPAQTARRQQ
jgi:peptidoglycan hydrolase-like protein with peptidoglycan-binding domain